MGQVIKGLDISSHQGDIDFERVKADGVRFVIIKVGQGLREMGTFRQKYLPAVLAAGLDWGAYWWSDAVTAVEAQKEAAAFVKALDGLRPTYPVHMDQEYVSAVTPGGGQETASHRHGKGVPEGSGGCRVLRGAVRLDKLAAILGGRQTAHGL
ncbi:MAG: GH25 family lysozyme [Ruthenibacterium lactatiformans]